MKEYLEKNKKKVFWVLAAGIIFLGIFLRSWNFSDWMRFELDQARDANVIRKALEVGPGELPLLGPKARGTFLRLGPIFYYFEYLSARFFGGTPPAMALSVLFFSVLSLPLFLFFCLRFFTRKISLILLSLFSTSLFLVMYSRFPWNPNPLVFFVLLFLFSLLKSSEEKEKNSGWWLIFSAISLSAATQLHFTAFIILPVVAIMFLAWKRPKIKARYWALAVLAGLFLYIPVIINETKTGGDNSKEFLKALNEEKKEEEGGMLRKIYFNFASHTESYALILTAKDSGEYLKINPKEKPGDNMSAENQKYTVGLLGILFFVLGTAVLFWKTSKEKDPSRKNFLVLNSIFLTISFLFFIPIALELSPRFFLLNAVLPFVFLGIFLEEMDKIKPGYRIGQTILLIVFLTAAFWNLSETKKRFFELGKAHRDNIFIPKDKILKETNRITYLQENLIVDYMLQKQEENGLPVYFFSGPKHLTAFEYLLERENIPIARLPYREIYREGNYFFVTPSDPDNRYDIGKYAKKYAIVDEREFGTLTALGLLPKEEFISEERQDFSKKKKESNSSAPKRYKWNEIFRDGEDEGDFDENEGENEG